MAQPQTGCLHDYELTISDMKLLENADVLIINGGGMESFLEQAMERYPDLIIVDTSHGIELLEEEEHHHHEEETEEEHAEHSHGHDHEGNPHIWLSPERAAPQAEAMAAALGELDTAEAKHKLENAMKQNFYYIGREWPYKNIKPRIIAEKYMEDHTDGELRDYKFFCFNGEPKALFIATERDAGTTKFDYFDLKFNHLDIKQKYPNSEKKIRKPETFEKMIEFSKVLSKGYPHIRVDFYEVDGKLYFGELTFYHFSGFMPFEPAEWDVTFGELLNIPK
ncbi:MAG: zinc ABC transporter substrate-binding protein [Anaerotignum sp.]|nr:zinc ABC transporter substrate-binding protein [Anaerotignum sp.]